VGEECVLSGWSTFVVVGRQHTAFFLSSPLFGWRPRSSDLRNLVRIVLLIYSFSLLVQLCPIMRLMEKPSVPGLEDWPFPRLPLSAPYEPEGFPKVGFHFLFPFVIVFFCFAPPSGFFLPSRSPLVPPPRPAPSLYFWYGVRTSLPLESLFITNALSFHTEGGGFVFFPFDPRNSSDFWCRAFFDPIHEPEGCAPS